MVINFRHFIFLLCIACAIPAIAQKSPTIEYEYAFSPKQGATAKILQIIDQARTSIQVAAYSFTSKPIAEALIKAQQRGVNVQVLVDKRQTNDKHSVFKYLLNHGIAARSNAKYSIMHNKFMIIDDYALQLGSYNYTSSAEKRNAENVLIIYNQLQLIAAYKQEWQKLWDEGE